MTPKVFRINHQGTIRKAAGLFVRSLESEGTECFSGISRKENVDIMNAPWETPIRFITARREQGAALTTPAFG
jgi:thiamine pyrophosphate-dependent acetolactate synthase large subunit-like protein